MSRRKHQFFYWLGIPSNNSFASRVSVRDIVAQSGPYRPGFCYCELEDIKRKLAFSCALFFTERLTWLSAGSYTVVASTFEVDLLGQFILTVASNIEVDVESIPPEGAVSCLSRSACSKERVIKNYILFSTISGYVPQSYPRRMDPGLQRHGLPKLRPLWQQSTIPFRDTRTDDCQSSPASEQDRSRAFHQCQYLRETSH